MEKKEGVCLSFHDVGYKVKVRRRCTEDWKQIIKNISGVFKPGMNAILGPTGSGKTTLLDVLAGRKDPAGVDGVVTIDGNPQPKNFKCMSGYVVQENLMMGAMTVRECIAFSANLRIPKESRVDKARKVDDILRELGLMKCAESKIGNEFVRGVSGGESKRTVIGMELITSPSFIFLDEPTTGLDANTATSVMELLQRLSKKGNTIIFSIHQPRYAIYKTFDNILLLDDGRTIYHGPTDMTLEYFERLGFVCEKHNNPSDFFMDIISSMPQEIMHTQENEGYDNEGIKRSDDNDVKLLPKLSLHEKYISSDIYASIQIELAYLRQKYQEQISPNSYDVNGGYANGFITQLKCLSKRSAINIFRNPQTLAMQITFVCIYAFIVGILFFQIGTKLEAGLQNRIGSIFASVMNQMFINMSSLELFIKGKKIFRHESASGYYKVSSYYLAKIFCDIIPMRLIPVTLFSFITYFMIGFQVKADKFFIYYLCVTLTTLAGSCVGFFISISVNTFFVANLTTNFTFATMMLYGGFLVNLKAMPAYLRWLQYFSIIRYSLNAIYISELQDLILYEEINGTIVEHPNIGRNYLEEQGIDYNTLWDLWKNILSLFLLICALVLLGYIQLRRMTKYN